MSTSISIVLSFRYSNNKDNSGIPDIGKFSLIKELKYLDEISRLATRTLAHPRYVTDCEYSAYRSSHFHSHFSIFVSSRSNPPQRLVPSLTAFLLPYSNGLSRSRAHITHIDSSKVLQLALSFALLIHLTSHDDSLAFPLARRLPTASESP